jgi:hypothetical protein
MPTVKSTAARKAKGGDWVSKVRVNGCKLVSHASDRYIIVEEVQGP